MENSKINLEKHNYISQFDIFRVVAVNYYYDSLPLQYTITIICTKRNTFTALCNDVSRVKPLHKHSRHDQAPLIGGNL